MSRKIILSSSQAGIYRRSAVFGPGGIRCPCCTIYSTRKENSKHFNRRERRMAKQQLLQKIRNGE